MKTTPASVLIKKAAGINKGSSKPHVDKVGKLSRNQAEEIAKLKMPDLTAANMDAAVRVYCWQCKKHGRRSGGAIKWHTFLNDMR